MNSWLLDIFSNTTLSSRQNIGANLNQRLISSNQMIFFSNSVCIYKFYVYVYVCVWNSRLAWDFLSSANTNFLVSEVEECLLGSIIFLFSDCGRVWEFLMLLNMGETWGNTMRTMLFKGCFEYPILLSFTFCYITSLSSWDVKSTELGLAFQAYTKATGSIRIELL